MALVRGGARGGGTGRTAGFGQIPFSHEIPFEAQLRRLFEYYSMMPNDSEFAIC